LEIFDPRRKSTDVMSVGGMAREPKTIAMPTVLLIEDDLDLAAEVRVELERRGYDVLQASSYEDGVRLARAGEASLIVMDRMLRGLDSLSIVEALRRDGVKTPVLVISALSSVDERIRGLKAGGDDYLIKPFALGEMAARVEALARRLDDVRVTKLRSGSLEMDLVERTVNRSGRYIALLPREFKLLEYFLRHPDQVVTRAMLLEDVWHYNFLPQTNVVDVHISNLRRKVEADGEAPLITNIRGAGFMLHADA
jgi:two-component system, OmpR family, response regulator